MNKLLALIIPFLLFPIIVEAQEIYTFNGKNYEFHTAAKGDLTLFWNTSNKYYHYFIEKDGELIELTNTEENGKFKKEYQQTLEELTPETNIPTDKLKFTLTDFEDYVKEHNATITGSSYDKDEDSKTGIRLGLFGGVTNSVYTDNPANEKSIVGGVELEIYGKNKFKRHSFFSQFRHTFKNEDFEYSKTALSFNYRFKIINANWFHLYVEGEFVDIYYYENPSYEVRESPSKAPKIVSESDFALDLPLSLGAGMAIKIGKGTFLTLSYNDFIAAGVDDNGETPIDFTAGLKFNL
ncbi:MULTISPECIES: hypothetical protein [Mesonia]|uniref:Uncharacterized protein n=1 Tax=Mesonia oceanica TaxID=2687242 RepID=A0AC61YAE1_9FLAO|nr:MULTISPECIES: hypothetical protein [Mesonia]MAN27488.1 hypothetical protein [Mesonia sp.]MAQ42503.1 hypothetical protein [Mesonia sp.]MBJ96866.1 hypothetical protein [Flavobacteriaceae bacterium]VVV01477.1 hypothetical protein FVB9532_02769 [Mesonia oceanica]|tara:strand:+ start:9756 stop:10640 length:885 start_codon:yes stop_codon:yes gene_type:complete